MPAPTGPTGPTGPAERLARLQAGAPIDGVLDLFDSLPAVEVEEMTGAWRGCGLPTGHRLDGVLERAGWRGKRFASPDDVDPLVMDGPRGTFALDPRFVPMRLVLRAAPLLRRSLVARAGRAVLPALSTSRPGARLRPVEYRGVVTATMTYDAQPVDDHFRRVDTDTLLGLMELRGDAAPFAFTLHRERA